MFDGEIYQKEVSSNIFHLDNMLDSDDGVSIVMGTPESHHVTEELHSNNMEDIDESRKKRISRKNDTRQYRQYRKKK